MNASSEDSDIILDGKIYAVIAYLSFFCFIPLIFKRDNPFVLFHGKQGLVLFLGQLVFCVFGIVFGLGFIKFGFFVLGVLALFGIFSALNGKYSPIIIISELTKQIHL